MKIGMFTDAFHIDNDTPIRIRYDRVGDNTGNLAFFRGLDKLFSPIYITDDMSKEKKQELIDRCDAFVSTHFIWILQHSDFSHVDRLLSMIGDKPFIPMSVGIQADNDQGFCMNKQTVDILKRIEERCVIGVRGNYTAEQLSQNGIKNISVIGCPSMFYKDSYSFKGLNKGKSIRSVCNFRCFWKNLSDGERNILNYFRDNDMGFVEQNSLYQIDDHGEYDGWLNSEKRLFFKTEEWSKYVRNYDFNIGMRFHGGVFAMQEGLRSLLITGDRRTSELAEFFAIPTISTDEFDASRPIEYYYDKADMSEFLARFGMLKENLKAFAKKNNLRINLR